MPSPPKTQNGESKSASGPGLARYWVAGFLGVALVLLVAFSLGVYAWRSAEEAEAERQLSAWSAATARTLANRVAGVQKVLREWAADPGLQQVVGAADEAGIRVKEEALARQMPEALGIRLLAASQTDTLTGGAPFASYAALDLMRWALNERRVSALEVHRVAQPDMHLAIAGPVLDHQGTKATGVVHLALPLSLLPQVPNEVGGVVRVLYQQRAGDHLVTLVLDQGGGAPQAGPDHFVEIPGTSLRVAAWLGRAGLLDSGVLVWAAIGYLGVLALVALALWLPYRGMGSALTSDHDALVALVEEAAMRRTPRRRRCRTAEANRLQDRLLPLLRPIVGSASATVGPPGLDVPGPALGGTDHSLALDEIESDIPPAGGYLVEEGDQARLPRSPARPATVEPGLAGAADLGAVPSHASTGIFGAYDIRGVVGQGIDPQVMRDIGHAVGSEVSGSGDSPVMVARDTRGSSETLTRALIAGLLASGRNVIDLGVAPTPLLYFTTRYQGDGSGVMVTASHNPPEYNGCKIVLDGQSIEGERMRAIARRVQGRDLVERASGAYQQQDLTAAYIDYVVRDITMGRGLKVVVDCGNGAAGVLAPALYRGLGCEVLELNCDLDGGFPDGRVPDPSQPEHVRDLSAAVPGKGADLGLAFDGDGDRLGVVDSNGRFVAMDRVLMLFAADVLSRHPGTDVVYDVKCTHLLAAEILRNGGRPVMWQSGYARLKAKLRETGAMLAGELSGHVIFEERWFGFDDAIYAGARLLELLALDPRPTADVFAALPDAIGTAELLVPVREGEQQRIMGQVLELADRLEGVTVHTIDGLRAEFDRGWGLVRASNTQPALSFRFQGDNQESLEMIQGLFRRLMERAAPGLALPF